MEKYNRMFQRLDHEQTRIQIREQLDLINKDDTVSAIATAMERGLLTTNKINKIMMVEQRSQPKRPYLRLEDQPITARNAFISRKLQSYKSEDRRLFRPNFVHPQVPGLGMFKSTAE